MTFSKPSKKEVKDSLSLSYWRLSTVVCRSVKNAFSLNIRNDLYFTSTGFNLLTWARNIVVTILWWSLIPVVTDLLTDFSAKSNNFKKINIIRGCKIDFPWYKLFWTFFVCSRKSYSFLTKVKSHLATWGVKFEHFWRKLAFLEKMWFLSKYYCSLTWIWHSLSYFTTSIYIPNTNS